MLAPVSLFLQKTLEALQEELFPPVPCSLPCPETCFHFDAFWQKRDTWEHWQFISCCRVAAVQCRVPQPTQQHRTKVFEMLLVVQQHVASNNGFKLGRALILGKTRQWGAVTLRLGGRDVAGR